MNGPTTGSSMPGKPVKPKASRLSFWRTAERRPLRCGQHVAQRLLPHAARGAHALLGQDQREVAAERAIDGVGEGEGKRTGRGLPGGHAAEERALGALQAQPVDPAREVETATISRGGGR